MLLTYESKFVSYHVTGKVFLPSDIIPPNGTKHILNWTDPVFCETRDCHLSAALLKLKEKGSHLKQMHSSRQNMDLTAIKDFISSEFKTVQVQYKSLNLRKYCISFFPFDRDTRQTERKVFSLYP